MRRHLSLTAFALCALLAAARGASAATPEETCQKGRHDGAAKYAACQLKALARLFGAGASIDKYDNTIRTCRRRYEGVWSKLQTKATGSTCNALRLVDNGDGTVTDGLTGLQWEKKQNLDNTPDPDDPHDADNRYTWSATGTAADGSVFTAFLSALNGGGCFAGHCDWRLPTHAELQTLVTETTCTNPALFCAHPIFGPTSGTTAYWSATTSATFPLSAWLLDHVGGFSGANVKTGLRGARAVRGGL